METIKKIKEWKERRNKFITISKCNENYNKSLLGIGYNPKRKKVNMVLGFVLVSVGIITLPFPCGSLFLIMFGIYLFNIPFSLWLLCKNVYKSIKFYIGVRF